MTNQPLHSLDVEVQHCRQAEGSPSALNYADLCILEGLQQAYAHVTGNARELGIDPLAIETVEAEGVEAFLKQLRDDLQARTYHPSQVTAWGRGLGWGEALRSPPPPSPTREEGEQRRPNCLTHASWMS